MNTVVQEKLLQVGYIFATLIKDPFYVFRTCYEVKVFRKIRMGNKRLSKKFVLQYQVEL